MSSNSEAEIHCSVPELVLSEIKEELPNIKHEVKIEEDTVLPELIRTEIKNDEYDHDKKEEENRAKEEEFLVKKEKYDLVIKKEEHDLDYLKCFTCPTCSMQFVNEGPFLDHILHQHHVNSASSEQKNKLSNQTIERLDHQVSNHSSLEIVSGERNEIEVHKEVSTTLFSLQDATKARSSEYFELISSELQSNHDLIVTVPQKVLFQCPKCLYCAKTKSNLWKHQQTVHDHGKRFQCSECSFITRDKFHLKRHQQSHLSEKLLYQCLHCPYHGSTKSDLRKHVKVIHFNEVKSYQCSECSFNTAHKWRLKRHERIHFGERPFKCSDCPYSAKQKSHLKQHQQSHLSEKLLYQCLHCPYRGRTKSDLRKHVKVIHLNEVKSYQCSECSFNTAHKSRLKQHERIHSGERPFKCSDCPYSAKQKWHLKQHQQTHLIKRTFQIEASSMESSFGISSSKV